MMSDLIFGAGLVLVFEGLVWALAPNAVLNFIEAVKQTPLSTMRTAGWIAVAAGLLLVWLVRG